MLSSEATIHPGPESTLRITGLRSNLPFTGSNSVVFDMLGYSGSTTFSMYSMKSESSIEPQDLTEKKLDSSISSGHPNLPVMHNRKSIQPRSLHPKVLLQLCS
jgi:hypothetical protein